MSIYPSRSILHSPAAGTGSATGASTGAPLRRALRLASRRGGQSRSSRWRAALRCAIAVEAVVTKFGHGPARLRSGTLASSGPAD
ncbi:hypothetical protein IMT09_28740 [Burkholderia cepacia]|uniref:hypothetical protein n=1 Tax=Burkholderia cepacia TaxID=292 RepID=UPI001867A159|nr:hypothetical protein [Burkholderia cepacia]MBE2972064.1 hypothetical protein [Burkholderia cepacia]